MERLIKQIRAELGIRRETTLLATAALLDWLKDPAGRSGYRLIDHGLDALDNPHRDDVSLAMSLRQAGLTLDQVDRFVESFLATLQAHGVEADPDGIRRLHGWLARSPQEGESVAVPY